MLSVSSLDPRRLAFLEHCTSQPHPGLHECVRGHCVNDRDHGSEREGRGHDYGYGLSFSPGLDES